MTIRRYQKNDIITQYKEGPGLLVHRDDVLRLQVRGFRQFNTAEMLRGRIEIRYSPRFTLRLRNPTGVQFSPRASGVCSVADSDKQGGTTGAEPESSSIPVIHPTATGV